MDLDRFRCRCGCGIVRMNPVFLSKLDALREMLAGPKPKTIEAYRCAKRPLECGEHGEGVAVKIAASGLDAVRVVSFAHALGFTGIGAKQHGPEAGHFVHVDTASSEKKRHRPHFWTYE